MKKIFVMTQRSGGHQEQLTRLLFFNIKTVHVENFSFGGAFLRVATEFHTMHTDVLMNNCTICRRPFGGWRDCREIWRTHLNTVASRESVRSVTIAWWPLVWQNIAVVRGNFSFKEHCSMVGNNVQRGAIFVHLWCRNENEKRLHASLKKKWCDVWSTAAFPDICWALLIGMTKQGKVIISYHIERMKGSLAERCSWFGTGVRYKKARQLVRGLEVGCFQAFIDVNARLVAEKSLFGIEGRFNLMKSYENVHQCCM